jgi:hypothetical protein
MKQTSTNRPSLYLAAIKSFSIGFATRVLSFIERHIPIGYEDDTGFHISA